jgi:cytochrome P450
MTAATKYQLESQVTDKPPLPIDRDIPEDRVFDVDFYDMAGTSHDYHQPWKDLQDRTAPHSLVWTPHNGGHWIATRARAIREIISDPDRFSSYRMTIPRGTDRSERWDVLPISLDPPEHGPYRALLNAGLSPKAVKARARQIHDLAISLIEGMQARGSCEFVSEYAEEFAIRILFMIMDLPFEDKPRMMKITDAHVTPDGSMTVGQVVDAFAVYLRPFIQQRVEAPGDDLISQISNGEINGRPITQEESVQMCVQTFAAGLESVRNALAFMMLRLANDPATRRQLSSGAMLLQRPIDEFMRRYSAMLMAREVVADMEYEGVRLEKGDMISCPVQLAGLDERENPRPMDLDLGRDSIGSVAFGAGPHFCAGRWLANLELKVTLQEWLARIPEFEVAPDCRIRFSGGLLGSVNALPLVW